jgi:hypothetical protein
MVSYSYQRKGREMTKPSITAVKEWELAYESEMVRIESGTAVFDEDYWKVVPAGKKATYFYGESAWSDAQRFASDIDSKAWVS